MITTPAPIGFEDYPVFAEHIETIEQWSALGRTLIVRAESATWDIADWAAMAVKFGKKKQGEEDGDWHTLKEFCEAHGLNYTSTKIYGYVARRIPKFRRLNLSFGHHAEVAALPDEQQDKWLASAQAEHWPVSELRRRIRESLGDKSAKISGGTALELPTEYTTNLNHWLTHRPDDFWTVETVEFWSRELKRQVLDVLEQKRRDLGLRPIWEVL